MLARSRPEHGLAVAIDAADGFELAGTVYEPRGLARGVVVINPGTGVPQRFFRKHAAYLAAGGLRVVTFDYRGIGLSSPRTLRGFDASMTDWAEDTRGVVAFVKRRWPDRPLLLVAHSFGAQAIGLVDELRQAHAALLVGAQFGYLGHWPPLSRALLRVLWAAVLPTTTALAGYLPKWTGMGEDLPKGVAREWAKWCGHPEYLIGHVAEARDRFARFDVPSVSSAVHAALSGAPLVHRRFAPSDLGAREVGHFGFFRPSLESSLWAEARGWLVEAAGARRPAGLRPHAPGSFRIDEAEVMRDLTYGRE
jgi:predicted alpha/beta hydrolase